MPVGEERCWRKWRVYQVFGAATKTNNHDADGRRTATSKQQDPLGAGGSGSWGGEGSLKWGPRHWRGGGAEGGQGRGQGRGEAGGGQGTLPKGKLPLSQTIPRK